ncbi:MAG: hypothetical protein IT290_06405 [Deltaproteobacteria bacterium]|nr:hypothetical protein [Deltaproteobacteria bacterium]
MQPLLIYCAAHVALIAPTTIASTAFDRRVRWWELVVPSLSAGVITWASTIADKPLENVFYLHGAVLVIQLNFVFLTLAHCAQWRRRPNPGWAVLLLLYAGCMLGTTTLLHLSPRWAEHSVGALLDDPAMQSRG